MGRSRLPRVSRVPGRSGESPLLASGHSASLSLTIGSVALSHGISQPPMRASTHLAGEARPGRPANGYGWLPEDQLESPDPWPAQDWFKQPAQGRREPARRVRPTRPDLPIQPAPSSRWARFAPSRVQWPWWVLCPWALISVLLHVHQAGQSWHFFAQGGQLLFGSGPGTGLQLYAAHPVLQIGPLALAVAGVLRMLGPDNGQVMAIAAMSVTGPVMRLLSRSGRRRNGLSSDAWPPTTT